jgi:hypothetical protein
MFSIPKPRNDRSSAAPEVLRDPAPYRRVNFLSSAIAAPRLVHAMTRTHMLPCNNCVLIAVHTAIGYRIVACRN